MIIQSKTYIYTHKTTDRGKTKLTNKTRTCTHACTHIHTTTTTTTLKVEEMNQQYFNGLLKPASRCMTRNVQILLHGCWPKSSS